MMASEKEVLGLKPLYSMATISIGSRTTRARSSTAGETATRWETSTATAVCHRMGKKLVCSVSKCLTRQWAQLSSTITLMGTKVVCNQAKPNSNLKT